MIVHDVFTTAAGDFRGSTRCPVSHRPTPRGGRLLRSHCFRRRTRRSTDRVVYVVLHAFFFLYCFVANGFTRSSRKSPSSLTALSTSIRIFSPLVRRVLEKLVAGIATPDYTGLLLSSYRSRPLAFVIITLTIENICVSEK